MSSVQLFVNAWLSVVLSEEGSSFDNFLQTTFQRKKKMVLKHVKQIFYYYKVT